ncbi:MAG: hypothetical protein ACJA0G_002525, partial [Kangiellaceae bacterium]
DYVLANAQAQELIRGVAAWHINADEPQVFEYADNFARSSVVKPLEYEDSSEYRSSDHDPIIVGMLFERTAILGDANNNGRLDYADFFIISRARRDAAGNGGNFDEAYDLNDDGKLDRVDLFVWRSLYSASR